jgi:hypothetical protein
MNDRKESGTDIQNKHPKQAAARGGIAGAQEAER